MHFRNPLTVNVGFALLTATLFFIRSGHAVELQELSIRSDTSKPATERIQKLYDLLLEEIQFPTQPRQGWGGGEINHDYTVAQIALGMWHLAKESPEVKDWLQQKLNQTPPSEVKDSVQIALGMAGDASVAEGLVGLLKKQDQPNRRALAASALGVCGAVLCIPDLAEALDDRHTTKRGGDVGELHGEDYPVRHAASLALRSLGVTVKNPDPEKEFNYQVDLDSAVKVIEPLLHSTDNVNVMDAIQAIKRMSGSRARETLQGFVKQNEEEASRQDLVIAAKAALTDIAVPGSVP